MASGLAEPKTGAKVKLIGEDGNAFAILARVERALKKAGRGDLVQEYLVDVEMDDRPRPGSASQANPGPAGRDEI